MILRAKTIDLLETKPLTEARKNNSALNKIEMQEGKAFLGSYPRRIVLELTNACNLRCVMCGRDEVEFNNTFFDIRYLEKLKEIMHHSEELTLFGWGEPTLHPRFSDLLEYADKYDIRKYFVTNGMRLHSLEDNIFKYHVDIMAVSLDGASVEINQKIRKGLDYTKVLDSLSKIVKIKEDLGIKAPYINFVFTAMKTNLHDIPGMVRLAHEVGIEEVKVVYLTVFSEALLQESLWGFQEEVKQVFGKSTELAENLGIKLKLPYLQGEDIAGNKFHKDCFVGWRDFFLGSDGFVRPCQSTSMKLFHFDKYGTFKEMWNSSEFQDFRRCVNNAESMPEECRRCYQSSHSNCNRRTSFIQTGETFAPKWE